MTMETRVSQWEDMNAFSHVPPGFRFHPTDEELVDYYLRKKIASRRIDLDVIKDVDLYKIEPWDLQELCTVGVEEQNEWYFFSHKDKKYPTGTRTNRATKAGFWKATGRDKAIYSKHCLIGMRKTLVFYQGRAPNGLKSDWIMHEYRLETNENGTPQEEGWVVCRVFRKRLAAVRKVGDNESPNWYEESFMPDFDSPRPYAAASYHTHPCKQELDQLHHAMPQEPFLQLPHLESPKVPQPNPNMQASPAFPGGEQAHRSYYPQSSMNCFYNGGGGGGGSSSGFNEQSMEQAGDWRVLDKFVASQLSNEDASQETNYGGVPPFHVAYSHHMNA